MSLLDSTQLEHAEHILAAIACLAKDNKINTSIFRNMPELKRKVEQLAGIEIADAKRRERFTIQLHHINSMLFASEEPTPEALEYVVMTERPLESSAEALSRYQAWIEANPDHIQWMLKNDELWNFIPLPSSSDPLLIMRTLDLLTMLAQKNAEACKRLGNIATAQILNTLHLSPPNPELKTKLFKLISCLCQTFDIVSDVRRYICTRDTVKTLLNVTPEMNLESDILGLRVLSLLMESPFCVAYFLSQNVSTELPRLWEIFKTPPTLEVKFLCLSALCRIVEYAASGPDEVKSQVISVIKDAGFDELSAPFLNPTQAVLCFGCTVGPMDPEPSELAPSAC